MTYPPPYSPNPNDQPGGFPPPSGFPQDQPPGYPPVGGYPPAGGYPPPMGGFPPPPMASRTNPMAIASLVCSIAGLFTCAVSSIVGLILGFVAMNQIKQSGEEGRGMALAGVIIGGAVLALTVIGVIVYFVFIAVAVSGGY